MTIETGYLVRVTTQPADGDGFTIVIRHGKHTPDPQAAEAEATRIALHVLGYSGASATFMRSVAITGVVAATVQARCPHCKADLHALPDAVPRVWECACGCEFELADTLFGETSIPVEAMRDMSPASAPTPDQLSLL